MIFVFHDPGRAVLKFDMQSGEVVRFSQGPDTIMQAGLWHGLYIITGIEDGLALEERARIVKIEDIFRESMKIAEIFS